MSWQGIVAVCGGGLVLLGVALFLAACAGDAGRRHDHRHFTENDWRHFSYGVMFGITGTLIAAGIVALLVAGFSLP